MHTAMLLLTCLACPAAADDIPTPLLELTFDEPLPAEAEAVDYAPGEGPMFLPGPWQDCLDLTAASRFGGTLEQMEPAGGAVNIAEPALDDLGDFTVTLWALPVGGAEAINSRALTKFESWELTFSHGRFHFVAVTGDTKPGYYVPSPARPEVWTFVSVVVSTAEGALRTQVGNAGYPLTEAVTHELVAPPDPSDGQLQVGTFGEGVRPFRGKLDNLRIFGEALSPEQVAAVFEADLASRGGALVYQSALPPMPTRRFTLKPSDIVFSSRWQTQRKEEAFRLMEDYHVDHLLWVYGNGPEYISEVHDLGITYEGTLNGLTGWDRATPELDGAGDTTGRQQDFDGNKVLLPHMRKWAPEHPRWTGNHNSDAFRAIFFEELDALVAAGIDALHIDDWEMAATTASGGLSGFSPETLAGFGEYVRDALTEEQRTELGIENADECDYREFLREKHGIETQEQYRKAYRDLPTTPHFLDFQQHSLREFYEALREHLDEVSPDKYTPVSVNNQFCRRSPEGGLRGLYCIDRLDFFVGEASRDMQTAGQYALACRTAEALGIPQVMMSKPHVLGHSQAALAASYALNAPFRVPWDLYMDNDAEGKPAPRYYGETEAWKPFYDFVEENSELLDSHRPAAQVGVLFNADEPCYAELTDACRRLTDLNVPFGLIGAASRSARVPLSRERLEAVRYAITLSQLESFSPEDRAVIEAAQADRRVRLLQPGADLGDVVAATRRLPLRVEGPENVHAFLHVRSEPTPSAIIHLVNWNAFPQADMAPGETPSEVYRNVTVSLADPESWGAPVTVTYRRPGAEALDIEPEVHANSLRITLPELATWGILHIAPTEG